MAKVNSAIGIEYNSFGIKAVELTKSADGKVSVPFGIFLGYKKGEDGSLVIDEEQAKVVRRIYREYLSGATAVAISKGLTSDGIETPGHKQKWHASTVRSILSNEKYKGEALLQKYYTPDFLTKKQKLNKIIPKLLNI